jgi:putative transferase (TIGR04331 family)
MDMFYEEYLASAAKVLNSTHRLNWDVQKWRILIGPWLYKVVQIHYYEKQIQKPNSLVAESSELSHKIIFDTNDFSFNLKQSSISQLATFFQESNKFEEEYFYSRKNNKKTFKEALKIPFFKIQRLTKNKICIVDSYLSFDCERKLEWKYNRNILSKARASNLIYEAWKSSQSFKYDKAQRHKLYESLTGNNDESKLNWLVAYTLPTIYLELFSRFLNLVTNYRWIFEGKIILTGTGVYYNEMLKGYICQFGSDSKLLILQHGGEYGYCGFSPFESHELKIADMYLTAGWTNHSTKVRKCFATFINDRGQKKIGKNSKRNIVTLVTNNINKKFTHWHTGVGYLEETGLICDDLISVNSILGSHFETTKIRRHPREAAENYVNLKGHLTSLKAQMNFWADTSSFDEVIHSSDLIVSMYPGTAFLNALASESPTILFHNYSLFPVRKQAQYLFDTLIDNQLSFTKLTDIKDWFELNLDLEKWWTSERIKRVRCDFLNEFAKPANNQVVILRNIFNEILDG